MTEIPVWRAALNDSSHPMHSIACDVFQEKFNAERVAKKHAERSDQIVPFLYAILDTEELHFMESPSGGFAPPNAIELLGEWQVAEAAPRLLNYISDEYEATLCQEYATFALQKMPPAIIEPVLMYGQQSEAQAREAMFILAHVGRGDERCFKYICSMFERVQDSEMLDVAEFLAINNLKQAKKFLRRQSKKRRFRHYKSILSWLSKMSNGVIGVKHEAKK